MLGDQTLLQLVEPEDGGGARCALEDADQGNRGPGPKNRFSNHLAP